MTQSSAMEMIQTGDLGSIRPSHGYYRQPNGWITVGVTTELEELAFRRENWQPLPQYGRFDMMGGYAVNHPLELLFMRGGAKELPLDQIIECGFNINPPLIPSCGKALNQFHKAHAASCWTNAKPVHFPQLDGLEWDEYPCRLCDDRAPFSTERARDQHERVMHKEEKSSIRTGQTLAEALIQGMGGSPQVSEPQGEVYPYICGYCGAGFTGVTRLAAHSKEHRQGDEQEEV